MLTGFNFQITPDLKFRFDLGGLRGKESLTWLLGLLNFLTRVIWMIFFLFLFSAHISDTDLGLGTLFWVYSFTMIFVGMQLMKRVISIGDYIPPVTYDLLLLSFTTVVSMSLLLSTLNTGGGVNIWGGSALRTISGISIVVFWFMYYVMLVNNSTVKEFKRIFLLFNLSPLVGLVLSFFGGAGIYVGIYYLMILFLPGWIWLMFTSNRYRWIYYVLFLLSLIILVRNPMPEVLMALVFEFLISLVIYLIHNFRKLGKILYKFNSDLEKFVSSKLSLGKFLSQHNEFLLMWVSLIFSLVGIVWGAMNYIEISANLVAGINNLISKETITGLLTGKGLFQLSGSFVPQFVYSFGLVVSLIGVIMLFWIFRDLIRAIWKTKNNVELGELYFIFCSLIGVVTFLIFNPAYDLLIIVFWILVGFAAIANKIYLRQQELTFSEKLFKNKRLKYLQFLSVLVIFIGIVYLLNLIPKLSILLA